MTSSFRRRGFLVAGMVVGTSALAHVWRPTTKIADQGPPLNLEAIIPSSFGDWRIDETVPVVLPAPNLLATLNRVYNQTLARTYVNSRGERIMLSIAYGGDQSDGMSAHWPQSCYRAQGFAINSDKVGELSLTSNRPNLRVRRLVAQAGSRVEPITYWVLLADDPVLSGSEMKVAQLKYGVRGLIPDGVLVRVSNISRDTVQSYDLHASFLRDLHGTMKSADAKRIFGEA